MKRKYGQYAFPASFGRSIRSRFIGTSSARNVTGRYSRGFTVTQRRQQLPRSGMGVTTQYDRKVMYSKKSMPRRKRVQWKKFVKKVQASLLKDFGTKMVLYNDQLSEAWSGDTQRYQTFVLYGKDGSSGTTTKAGYRDLVTLFANDPDLADATSLVKFFSGVIDVTISNNSYYTDGTTTNDNLSMEVDIYEFMFSKDNIDAVDIQAMITRAENNTAKINALNAQIQLTVRGVTPWELPDMLAQGVKILKKTKYVLTRGQNITYQFRDPRNFSLRKDYIDTSDDNFVIKGKTKGFMVLAKGVPTLSPTAVTKRIDIGVTRKYGYKVLQGNMDADNILV